jgi:hypothetical protein
MNQDSVTSCFVVDPKAAGEAPPVEKRGLDEETEPR